MLNHIGKKQCFIIFSLLLLGSVSTMGTSGAAGRDGYIVFFLGGILAIPLYLIYFKMVPYANQGYGSAPILTLAIRGIFGVAALHSASISLGVFTIFLSQMSLPKTPNFVICLFIALTLYFMCRSGITVVARVAELIFYPVILFLLITTFSSLGQIDLSNLYPMMAGGIAPIITSALATTVFPFSEGMFAVLIICHCCELKDAKKSVIGALLFSTIMVTLMFLKNTAVMGFPLLKGFYFPSFSVASTITLGTFFQRMEVFISIAFMFCELIKMVLLVLYAQHTFSKMAKNQGAVCPVFPLIALLVLNTIFLLRGIVDTYVWLMAYRYYMVPITIIIPIVLTLFMKKKTPT